MQEQQKATEKMNGAAKAIKSEASDAFKDFTDSAIELKDRVQAASSNAVEQTVDVVKKYPVYTALGAAAVGFIAGIFINRNKH